MSGPMILEYNLDKPQKLKLMFVCAQLKIACHSVPREDYNQPIAALAGMRRRAPESYDGAGFTDEMLVMVNFTGPLLNAFLNALRQNRATRVALKAVMTPSNADWDSVKLHEEILKEHIAMHQKKK